MMMEKCCNTAQFHIQPTLLAVELLSKIQWIGGKVIARETISGYRKDVISRIHGGGARDRKKKLLEKQKKGKARMRQFGSVDIPQEAFIEVLKINKNE